MRQTRSRSKELSRASEPTSRPSEPLSAKLLRRALAGESDALSQLLSRYMPQLQRWAHRRVPDWARNGVDTGDLVQDALLDTFRNFKSFVPEREDALLRYLRRTLVNRVRDQFRYAARHPTPGELNDALVDSGASPLKVTMDRENRRRYRAALKRLRTTDRDAIVGCIELGYTYEQLALVLKKSTPEAARIAVRRALLRLEAEMRRA